MAGGTYGTSGLWWLAWFPVDAVVATAVALGDIDL